jgi:hypothetical protein
MPGIKLQQIAAVTNSCPLYSGDRHIKYPHNLIIFRVVVKSVDRMVRK